MKGLTHTILHSPQRGCACMFASLCGNALGQHMCPFTTRRSVPNIDTHLTTLRPTCMNNLLWVWLVKLDLCPPGWGVWLQATRISVGDMCEMRGTDNKSTGQRSTDPFHKVLFLIKAASLLRLRGGSTTSESSCLYCCHCGNLLIVLNYVEL